MPAPLRVGVPTSLVEFSPLSSVGRIWRHVLGELRRPDVELVIGEARSSRWRRRADVWISDGHQGPLDVRQPVVAHLLEAAWADPELRPLFEPWFLDRHEQP